MALIKCKECNKEISDTANVCIGCGAKLEVIKKTSLLNLYLIVLFSIFVYSCMQQSSNESTSKSEIENLPRPTNLTGDTYEEICLDSGWRIKGGGSANSNILPYMISAGYLDSNDEINIKEKTIRVGGSRCMLIASWGKAEKINTTTNQYGVNRQHIYGDSYVYTDDDVITSIQQ